MESVLEFSMKCNEDNIKSTRKLFMSQLLWVTFNISLLIFDWHTFINSPWYLTSFAFGAMFVTTLWSFIYMLQTWFELRTEKLRLKYLSELREAQIASGEREQYLQVKKHYEQLIEKLKEK